MPAKKYHVDLTEIERSKLESIITKRKSTSEIVKRSNILLAADRNGLRNWGDAEIASQYAHARIKLQQWRYFYWFK